MQMELATALRRKDISSIQKQILKMIRSSDCRFLAVYKTISSKGSRSKGIADTHRPTKNADYLNLHRKLWDIVKHPNKYKSTPLKRVWIPKPNSTEFRPLSVPSYIDRAIQHLYLFVLDVIYEEIAEPNSYGFRAFRSPGWASKAITLFIWSRKSFGPPKFAIQLDIKKCFDSISHDFIIKNVGKINISNREIELINNKILSEWLKSGYIDIKGIMTPRDQVVPTLTGIPQGGPISPTISNMVLNGIETVVKNLDIKSEDLSPKISPSDKIVWEINGKEILCTINTGPEHYTELHHILKDLGHKILHRHVRNVLQGRCETSGGLGARYINQNNSMQTYKESLNNSKTALFRFADDCVIFANSEETASRVLSEINSFLQLRGLELNTQKTQMKNLQKGERFQFVGFEYAITRNHGKWKVYNFPPRGKIQKLHKRINETIYEYRRSPYLCFYMVNSILRGWCNFYSVGNTKKIFNTLRRWIWLRVYRYLFQLYSMQSKYKRSSQRLYKKKISSDVFSTNLLAPYYDPKGPRWWAIPPEFIPKKGKRYTSQPYYLYNPGYTEVSTPSIITRMSSYHPDDRPKLEQKALYWQRGLLLNLLKKSNGQCKNCGCTLVDLNETLEIHHIQPKQFKGKMKFTNLAVLCKECHQMVTNTVRQRNLEEIAIYESNKILQGVTLALETNNLENTDDA